MRKSEVILLPLSFLFVQPIYGATQKTTEEVFKKIIQANNIESNKFKLHFFGNNKDGNNTIIAFLQYPSIDTRVAFIINNDIFVNTDILKKLNQEEIGGIISHEIAHNLLNRYGTQEDQIAADLLALDLMQKAGLNPYSFLTMMKKLPYDESKAIRIKNIREKLSKMNKKIMSR